MCPGLTAYTDQACVAGNDVSPSTSTDDYQACVSVCEGVEECQAAVWTPPNTCLLKTVCERDSMVAEAGTVSVRKGNILMQWSLLFTVFAGYRGHP